MHSHTTPHSTPLYINNTKRTVRAKHDQHTSVQHTSMEVERLGRVFWCFLLSAASVAFAPSNLVRRACLFLLHAFHLLLSFQHSAGLDPRYWVFLKLGEDLCDIEEAWCFGHMVLVSILVSTWSSNNSEPLSPFLSSSDLYTTVLAIRRRETEAGGLCYIVFHCNAT